VNLVRDLEGAARPKPAAPPAFNLALSPAATPTKEKKPKKR